MDNFLVDTFLAVVKNRNITQAAYQLYVSQSTVSSRIQLLEKELGVKLIERRKGIRSVELTPEGIAFIPIAQRYSALTEEIQNFSTTNHKVRITISAPDSVNVHLFIPLYDALMNRTPPIDLHINTHQSQEIYNLVSNHEADVGFVLYKSHYKNVITELVLREPMVFLLSSNGDWPDGPLHPSMLNSENELFLPWSSEIVSWHDYWWNTAPRAQFDTASLLVRFLIPPNSWAISPVSVAMSYKDDPRVIIRDCSVPIPPRDLYMITERNMRQSDIVKLFKDELSVFLQSLQDDSKNIGLSESSLINLKHR